MLLFKSDTINGVTPPIDGEYFSIKRGYKLRPSTLKKLYEIKAINHDVNLYMNTIIDAAIIHYHNFIISQE